MTDLFISDTADTLYIGCIVLILMIKKPTHVDTVINHISPECAYLQYYVSIMYTECVRRNPSTRTASRTEMEEGIKKWLLGVRDREGGRKRRAGQPGQDAAV